MRRRITWGLSFLALALVCMAGAAAAEDEGSLIVDDVLPYEGSIGPDSPLYGLKIAFEGLDLSFTPEGDGYISKQLTRNGLRLSEAKGELLRNNTDAADRALTLYQQTAEETRLRLQAAADANSTGLLHAQETTARHQLVLENLLRTHPDNTGLAHAYNNSLALEAKFEEKTQVRLERLSQNSSAAVVKAVRIEVKEETGNEGTDQTIRVKETNRAVLSTAATETDAAATTATIIKPTQKATLKKNDNNTSAGNGKKNGAVSVSAASS